MDNKKGQSFARTCSVEYPSVVFQLRSPFYDSGRPPSASCNTRLHRSSKFMWYFHRFPYVDLSLAAFKQSSRLASRSIAKRNRCDLPFFQRWTLSCNAAFWASLWFESREAATCQSFLFHFELSWSSLESRRQTHQSLIQCKKVELTLHLSTFSSFSRSNLKSRRMTQLYHLLYIDGKTIESTLIFDWLFFFFFSFDYLEAILIRGDAILPPIISRW